MRVCFELGLTNQNYGALVILEWNVSQSPFQITKKEPTTINRLPRMLEFSSQRDFNWFNHFMWCNKLSRKKKNHGKSSTCLNSLSLNFFFSRVVNTAVALALFHWLPNNDVYCFSWIYLTTKFQLLERVRDACATMFVGTVILVIKLVNEPRLSHLCHILLFAYSTCNT